MNCFFHEDQVAVATCQDCGIGLCKECASKYTPALCPECAKKRVENNERQHRINKANHLSDVKSEFFWTIIGGVIIAAVIFVICIPLGILKSAPIDVIVYMIIGFFASFGWKITGSFKPNFNESNVMVTILIYLLRYGLSVILGIPCFVFALIKLVKGLETNRRM